MPRSCRATPRRCRSATDEFDRYVSCGSIEYWPDPQAAIAEAYRVVKPGGIALIVGPLPPERPLARRLADLWMLFPPEAEYRGWMSAAGFTDLRARYVAPDWTASSATGSRSPGASRAPASPPPPARPRESVNEPMTAAPLGALGRRARPPARRSCRSAIAQLAARAPERR